MSIITFLSEMYVETVLPLKMILFHLKTRGSKILNNQMSERTFD